MPLLPYDYDALEPYIDTETMHYHHDKHFKTYVDQLNKALEPYVQYHNWSLTKLLRNLDQLPKELQMSVRKNGGGVYNHTLYFDSMRKGGRHVPKGPLATLIDQIFGSYENLRTEMKKAGLNRFGSGWAWLVADSPYGLEIITTLNQDVPLEENKWPLLPLDVWEHAYYLKHKNERDQYIDDWFHVVDWRTIENRIHWVAKK